jgi:hypothetical protein
MTFKETTGQPVESHDKKNCFSALTLWPEEENNKEFVCRVLMLTVNWIAFVYPYWYIIF